MLPLSCALLFLAALMLVQPCGATASDVEAATTRRVFPRYPVQMLMNDPSLWRQRELFLLALDDITTMPDISSIYSHYQLGGVHGLPFVTYNGAPGDAWVNGNYSWWGGHCWHFTNPWMHWHRYYVVQYETAIAMSATRIAQSMNVGGHEKKQWQDAAKRLRFPRYDWFDPAIATNGLPRFFLEEDIQVVDPANPSTKKTIHNPLYSYKMQANPSESAPPNDLGTYFKTNAPYNLSRGQYTYRYPVYNGNGTFKSSPEMWDAAMRRELPGLDIEVRLALQPTTWDCFALGPANRVDGSTCNDWAPNANDLHGSLHILTGGINSDGVTGTMVAPEMTGFDPIFFLHHSNVDFIFSLYQAWRPNVTVTPGPNPEGEYLIAASSSPDALGPSSAMPPWFKTEAKTSYYTVSEMENYYQYGYTYVEIQDAAKAAGLPPNRNPTSVRSRTAYDRFRKTLDTQLYAKYNLKSYLQGYAEAMAFVMDSSMVNSSHWTLSVFYTANGQNISCGTAIGFVSSKLRYPTVQLSGCLQAAGVLTATKPPPKVAADPSQGPACTPIPAQIPITNTAPFTITVYPTETGVPLTPAQLQQAFPKADSIRTYWAYEESFFDVPAALNQGLPAC